MRFLVRLRYFLRRRQADRELAEEIEFHRHMSGEPKAMGNITRAREDARAVWIWPWLESFWQDAAYAIRNLRRSPGFAVIAVLTLGTAIGLNTSFFTVFNAVALRPWPVKDPSRVVKIYGVVAQHRDAGGLSVIETRYLAEHARSFSGIAVLSEESVRFGFEGFGAASHAMLVMGNHFQMLGVEMLIGRGFLPEEDRVEAPEAVAVLSYPYWRDHFGSDPGIIGKHVVLNDIAFTVVGVTPESFTGTSEGGGREEVYLPLPALLLLHPTESWARDVLTKPDQCCGQVLGRLAPGISRAQAATELEVLDRQFSPRRPAGSFRFVLASSVMLDNPGRTSQVTAVFALMFAGVTMVLLLACANVGNLLVARAGARQKEIEIRRAIGAGRARIIRQLMTESLLLALGSTVLGLAIAYRLPLFVIARFGEIPPLRFTPDSRVLAYAIALAAFACISFGLAPALHGTRPSLRSRLPLRNALLAAQVLLSVVLLTGAGLALQGIARLRHKDPGFRIAGVSVVSFEFPARASDAQHMRDFYLEFRNAAPNGDSVAITAREPLISSHWAADFQPSGQAPGRFRGIEYQEVTGGYFDLLRIPVIAGRNFVAADEGRNVMLVNESLARLYWQNELPVGKTVQSRRRTWEIVGVVKDAYTSDLDQIEPTYYVPFNGASVPKILASPAEAQSVVAVARQIEPRIHTQTLLLQDNADRWFVTARVGAEIAGALGLFALILATVGMAGVFAYAVQQRTKEIGIRMALGARPGQVLRQVLSGSSRAIFAGVGIGLPCAFLAARLMRNVMYGVSPLDPVAYISVTCILAVAGIAASYAPARRASRVDPLTALRHD